MNAVLVLVKRGQVGLRRIHESETIGFFRTFVVPPGSGPVYASHGGRLAGVEFELVPWEVQGLLGRLLEPSEGVVDLESFRSKSSPVAKLLAAADQGIRLADLKTLVRGPVVRSKAACSQVIHAWTRLSATWGRILVRDLAWELGWSERYFQKRFVAETRLRPVFVARHFRFAAARHLLESSKQPIADIAAQTGFADQAHLNREAKRLLGVTPSFIRVVRFADLPGTPAPRSSSDLFKTRRCP
ncbi:MAG: helix-turn-helix transcriptional regulator [Myxococcota bacterium]